jgi:hypothetical protein
MERKLLVSDEINTFCCLLIKDEEAILRQLNEYAQVRMNQFPVTGTLGELGEMLPKGIFTYHNALEAGKEYRAAVKVDFIVPWMSPIRFNKEIRMP